MKRTIKIDSDWSKIGCCSIKVSKIGREFLCAAIKFAPILFNIAPFKARQTNRKNKDYRFIAFAAVVKSIRCPLYYVMINGWMTRETIRILCLYYLRALYLVINAGSLEHLANSNCKG